MSSPVVDIVISLKKVAPPTNFQGIGMIIDLGTSNVPVGEVKYLVSGEESTIFDDAPEDKEVYKKLLSCFQNAGNRGVYVFNAGHPAEEDYTEVFTRITNYLQNGEIKPYAVAVPYEFWGLPDFLTLATTFTTDNSMVYFIVDTKGVTFSTGTWAEYQGLKSVLGIYRFEDDTIYPSAGMLGIFISAKTNPLSPVNKITSFSGSQVIGYTKLVTDTGLVKQLQEEHIAYMGRLADENVIFNINTANGKDFNYWFNIDYIQALLAQSIEYLIYNGINTQERLDYNQIGIDKLKTRISNTLLQTKSIGVSNTYSNECIPFEEYIKTFPSDYATSHYGGASAIVDGQKYILTIQLGIEYS